MGLKLLKSIFHEHMLICKLLLICGEVRAKIESKHLETFREMRQGNFVSVKLNTEILCTNAIFLSFSFLVMHFSGFYKSINNGLGNFFKQAPCLIWGLNPRL